MPNPVYVIGHKSPDTDAIVSAIGYADLKRRTGMPNATPVRLGDPMPETRYLLERFGMPEPVLIRDVFTRVRDVMNPAPRFLLTSNTIQDAGGPMRDKRIVPVVDRDHNLHGVLTLDDIASRYLEEMDLSGGVEGQLSFTNLVRTLQGDMLVGDTSGEWKGHVYMSSMRPDSLSRVVRPGDMVVLGDREEDQRAAIEAGASCIVAVNDAVPNNEILQLAEDRHIRLITTRYDSYRVTRLLNLSVTVDGIMRRDVATAEVDDLAMEASETLAESRVGALPVVDEHGKLVGILSRTDLLRQHGKEVILVDHNHLSQAVDGLDQARVIEVVDHHNLGDLQTHEPILMTLEPVGSTSTIVAETFRKLELTPTPDIAGVLAGGIISDTMLFRSPTCTDRDRDAGNWLASICDVDLADLAHEMFSANSNYDNISLQQLLHTNLKVYEWGGKKVGIGQAETVNMGFFDRNRDELIDEMRQMKQREGWSVMLFLATDILAQDSVMFMPDDEERILVARAFNTGVHENSARLEGVVSRKKQVVPPLSRELS